MYPYCIINGDKHTVKMVSASKLLSCSSSSLQGASLTALRPFYTISLCSFEFSIEYVLSKLIRMLSVMREKSAIDFTISLTKVYEMLFGTMPRLF